MHRPADMARPEIPSIVVHNGSNSISPVSPSMDQSPEGSRGHPHSIGAQSALLSCDGDSSTSLSVDPCDLPSSIPLSPSPCSPSTSPASPPHCSGNLCYSQPRESPHSPISVPQGPGPGGGMPPTAVGQGGPHSPHMGCGPISPHHVGGIPPRSRSLELPHQRSSTDSEKDSPINTQRHRHGAKLKLLQRSHAMREDTSPPPDILDMGGVGRYSTMGPPPPHMGLSNSLQVGGPGPPMMVGRRRLRHQGSSGGSFEESSPCLSRDSSQEYTDSSGVELLPFIVQTLHKNQKDRLLLLKIEKELVTLVKDSKRTHHRFPQMSSYQRMLVHRVAAFFGLEHNVDQVGTSVIVNKSRQTRLPQDRFRDHCRDELLPPEEPMKRSILRRGFASYDDDEYKCSDRHHGLDSRRCKSFEEREQEYDKSFSSMDGMLLESPRHYSHDSHMDSRRSSHDESRWHDSRKWVAEHESHRIYYDSHRLRPIRLPKVSSFESGAGLHPKNLRPPVFKSHSFGGYSGGVTVLSRGDSVASNPPPSRLSKQDSLSSRLSEHSSSSGYKTQRQDTSSTNVSNTMSTTPSPTAGHGHGQHFGQSGQPYMNSDGSAYRFDPSNPPPSSHGGRPKSPNSYQKGASYRDKEDREVKGYSDSTTDHTPDTLLSPNGAGSVGHPHAPNSQSGSASPHSVPASTPEKRPDQQRQEYFKEESEVSMGKSESLKEESDTYSPIHSSMDDERTPHQSECMSEVNNQMQSLSLCTSRVDGPPIISSPPTQCIGPVMHHAPHGGYPVARHPYHHQAVYYLPSSVSSLAGGGIKYVYPHSSPMQPPHPPQPQTLPVHPQSIDGQSPVAPGYMPAVPSGYTVMTYPSNGVTPSSQGPHESGGTTYYCPVPGGVAPVGAPHPPNIGPAINPAATPTHHYAPLPPTSTSHQPGYPVALNYYSNSSVNGSGMNPMYPPQGYPHTGVYGSSPVHMGPAGPTATMPFRAPTPPQTPCTQAMNLPIAYPPADPRAVMGAPGGVGSQYVLIPPGQQTPAAGHGQPQIFTTFYRPSIPMLTGGSTGTPPPTHILQYGGVPVPPGTPTAHPPVFAKPFVAPTLQHPPYMGEKEETKRYLHSGVPGPTIPGGGSTIPHAPPHLITSRAPYTFMQNNMARGGCSSNVRPRGPILITATPHPRQMCPPSGGQITPLMVPRPPKIKRAQKSRVTYRGEVSFYPSNGPQGDDLL